MKRARKHPWEWLALAAAAAALASCAQAPCDAPYSCPQAEVDGGAVLVNCQPPVDGSPECAGTCHAWIAENCPAVVFLH